MRAVSAGFTKFCPIPPNICLTTTIATTPPNAAISGLIETGRFIASRMPVTTQERSPTVWRRFITTRERYSLKMHDATDVRMITAARKPKIITEAIMAGVSAMMTSSMMLEVVSFAWKCGEDETISLFISLHRPFSHRACPDGSPARAAGPPGRNTRSSRTPCSS